MAELKEDGAIVPVDNEEVKSVVPFDYGEYDDGTEEVNVEDLSLPYLNILDSSSKKVEDLGLPKGSIFNSVTGVAIDAVGENDPGLNFVICAYEKYWKEQIPYEDCKGVGSFVGLHKRGDQFVKDAIKANGGKAYGKLSVANGTHELSESIYLYGLVLNEDATESEGWAVFELRSKNLGRWNKWYTSMMTAMKNPKIFTYRSNVKTALTPNKKGKDSYEIKVSPIGANWKECRLDPLIDNERAILDTAFNFRKKVEEGSISVNFSAMSDEDSMSDEAAAVADQFKDGQGENPQF